VTVKKSGFEDAEVIPAQKESRGWFGGGPKYKYLSRAVRDAIDDAPGPKESVALHRGATIAAPGRAARARSITTTRMCAKCRTALPIIS
jgi:hypothetical protein